MDWISITLGIVGGLGIFLYGMYIASEGLKKSASHQLRRFLKKVTKNQAYGAGAGAVLAAALQSSTAATVMIVGFVNAGLMSLRRAMGVVLGSAVGTTLTVQLIAFQITDYALLFVGIGVLFYFISGKATLRSVGTIILGFGFVFYGIGLMTEAMEPVQHHAGFMQMFLELTQNPIVTVLLATIFTAIIQNSAATIAIAMSLVATGPLPLETGLAVVYGANLGTVVTAMISSLTASKDAQRTAVAHAIFKFIGVLVFLPLTTVFAQVVQWIGGDMERQIANAHTLFNIVNLVILLPFCNRFADWMVRLLPEKDTEAKHVKYLEKNAHEFPTIALMQARKELEHMSERINDEMVEGFPNMIDREARQPRQKVIDVEAKVDHIYKAVYHHLQKVTEMDLSDRDSEEGLKLLYINNELEGISDTFKQMAESGHKLETSTRSLTQWETEALLELYEEVKLSYQQMAASIRDQHTAPAMEVIQRNAMIIRKEKELRFQHFNQGSGQSSMVSSIFADIMNDLLRIQQHSVNISQTMIGIV